jgi:hypothetical protein
MYGLEIPGYQFESNSHSELPGGNLIITGGGNPALREVVKIDTLREYAVCSLPPMHTARQNHAALYHSQYLYVLGGNDGRMYLRECERYVCAESRWEELPSVPVACKDMSAVELDNSLYALGGEANYRKFNTVQKMSLDSLTWEFMQLKLPQACSEIACFKTDTQVYLMIGKTLYSFTPLEVKPIKTFPDSFYACYSSYYIRGTLYYEFGDDGISSLAVGELA